MNVHTALPWDSAESYGLLETNQIGSNNLLTTLVTHPFVCSNLEVTVAMVIVQQWRETDDYYS